MFSTVVVKAHVDEIMELEMHWGRDNQKLPARSVWIEPVSQISSSIVLLLVASYRLRAVRLLSGAHCLESLDCHFQRANNSDRPKILTISFSLTYYNFIWLRYHLNCNGIASAHDKMHEVQVQITSVSRYLCKIKSKYHLNIVYYLKH